MNMEDLEAAEAAAGEQPGGQDGGGESQTAGTTARVWSDAEWREWNSHWWSSREWDPWSSSHWNGMSVRESGGPSQAAGGSDPQARDHSGEAAVAASREEWRRDEWWQGKWWSSPQQKGDFTDPPSWGGWPNFRLWKRAVTRWHRNTDVAMWRRSEKLLKSFEWDLQSKLDHIPESVLSSENYLQSIFEVMDTIAGEKESSEKRRCVRAALYEGSRHQGESLASYAMRREAQFLGAEKYMSLPDDLKAFMLEEQSGLNRQGIQNLRVLTGGKHNYSEVQQALKVLDTEEESIFKPNSKTAHYLETGASESAGGNNYFQDKETASDSEEDEDLMLFAIEESDLQEGEALSFVADWGNKKRSWKENRQWKAARKKDRRHFDSRESRPRRPDGQRRLSVEELKRVTRCANCGQRGHWREDCTQPLRARDGSSQGNYDKDKNKGKSGAANPTGFAFLGLSKGSSGSFSHWSAFGLNLVQAEDGDRVSLAVWLSIPGGEAIVDPGASQDLIGLAAFEKLKARLAKVNLQPIVLDEAPSDASGIGGKAKPLFMALTPCCLGGYPGVVKLTVLQEDVPHLLSVGLLEMAKSVIDTGENMIFFKAFGTESALKRLNTGHRLLDVATWSGDEFPIPDQIANEYGLAPGSFNLTRACSEYEGSRGKTMGKGGTEFQRYFCDIILVGADHKGFFGDEYGNVVKITNNSDLSSEFPDSSRFQFCSVFVKCGDHFVLCLENMRRSLGSKGFDLHDSFKVVVSFFTCQPFRMVFAFDVISVFKCEAYQHGSENSETFLGNKSHDQSCAKHQARIPPRSQTFDQEEEAPARIPDFDHVESGGEASGWKVEDTRRREDHVGTGLGDRWKPLVPSGSKAAGQQSRDGQSEASRGGLVCDSGCTTRDMQSSSRQDCSWGESIRKVDSLQSMQDQTILRGLQRQESTHQEQEEDRSDLCASTEGSAKLEGQVQGQGRTEHHLHGHFKSRADGGLGETGRVLGEWHSTSAGPAGAESASDAADHAGYAEQPSKQLSTTACNTSGGTICDALCRRGHGESQPGRLGSAALSLASVVGGKDVSPELFPGDSKHWFAQSLGRKSFAARFSSGQQCHTWQNDVGDTWLCWYDSFLSTELCFSDDFDDREFQVTHKQKRALKSVLHDLEDQLLTDNSGRHFVSSLQDGSNVATRTMEEQGEDLRTSRTKEEQGEDLRTSRKHQENNSQESQEPKGQHQFAAVSGDPMIREALARSVHGASKCVMVSELFSPARVGKKASSWGLRTTSPPAFDRVDGWEFFDVKDRSHFWKVLDEQQPDVILMTPDCKAFSQMMESNWDRMDEEKKKIIQQEGLQMLHFCIEVAEYQLKRNKYFLLEQPAGASSWATHAMMWLLGQPGVLRFVFDQCATGLSVEPGWLSRKSTGIVTNHMGIAAELSECQCSGDHQHLPLENGRTSAARIFPEGLIDTILDGIKLQNDLIDGKKPSWCFLGEGEEDENDEEEEVGEEPSGEEVRFDSTSSDEGAD